MERIRSYSFFTKHLPDRFQHEPPQDLLNDITRFTLIACEEGLIHELGARAHDAFQLCAMYGDAKHAAEWENLYCAAETLKHGADSPNALLASAKAKDPQASRHWAALGRKILSGPVLVHTCCQICRSY